MNWYYAVGGQQQGPVDDAQLDALVSSGQINAETLVWHEGMPNWQPLRQARPGAASAGLPPQTGAMPSAAGATASTGDVVCAECGKIFTRDNAIQYGATWVCATCKPIFLQKLREGSVNPGELRFAGFWIRAVAKFVDGLVAACILGIPFAFIFMGTGAFNAQGQNQNPDFAFIALQLLIQVLAFGFTVVYNTFLIGKYGATLGKMAVGIRVVTADQGRVTYMRAFGRAWADILSGMICYIGYIIAAFDAEKRALHDHICSTRVVYK